MNLVDCQKEAIASEIAVQKQKIGMLRSIYEDLRRERKRKIGIIIKGNTIYTGVPLCVKIGIEEWEQSYRLLNHELKMREYEKLVKKLEEMKRDNGFDFVEKILNLWNENIGLKESYESQKAELDMLHEDCEREKKLLKIELNVRD